MVVEIQLSDGREIEKHVYRKVHQHNLASYVAGFYANKPHYKWGVFTRLKGTERVIVHAFGSQES